MSIPLIAIVGRPNVGKSTLFNRLIGKRKAIVEDISGITRDRNYGRCEWVGRELTIVDTGGLELNSSDDIKNQVRHQAEIAIQQADIIVFVVDLKSGIIPADLEVAELLSKVGKPVLVAVNKCDRVGVPDPNFYEFYSLGLQDVIEISATHGYGIGDLLDAVLAKISFKLDGLEEEAALRVSIVGKPNVGKSSLINMITKEERAIVSDISGTTRDPLDSLVENSYGKFVFVDTAGIRRKSKVIAGIEHYSVLRAFKAIESSDVCLVLIDALEGFTEQDTKIAGYAYGKGKGIIVVVNKWDAISKDTKTMGRFRRELQVGFSFISYVPMCFISAKTGLRIEKLYEKILKVSQQLNKRITTGALNLMLAEAVARVQPPTDKGKQLKVYYLTQIGIGPPTFVVFVNSLKLFHFSYKRYIENQIREIFGFDSVVVRILARERKGGGKLDA